MIKKADSLLMIICLLSEVAMIVPSSSRAAISPTCVLGNCDRPLTSREEPDIAEHQSKQDLSLVRYWAGERAARERDLDFSVIDSDKLGRNYVPLRDVVEAEYNLGQAEKQLMAPNSSGDAIASLRRAKILLSFAVANADGNEKGRFAAIMGKLETVMKSVGQDGNCWTYKLANAFENIDFDIEDVLRAT